MARYPKSFRPPSPANVRWIGLFCAVCCLFFLKGGIDWDGEAVATFITMLVCAFVGIVAGIFYFIDKLS